MRMTARMLVCGVLLALLQTGASWLRQGYFPESVAIPDQGVEHLPLQFGAWVGENVPTDPRVASSLGAHTIVDRRYLGPAGEVVYMHIALWPDKFESVPHLPEECYSRAGWRISQSQRLSLGPAGPDTARVLVLEQTGANAHALYWYQLGERTYVDRAGLRDARLALWGRPEWPSTFKVLLHRSDAGRQQGIDDLKRFASALAPHLNELY